MVATSIGAGIAGAVAKALAAIGIGASSAGASGAGGVLSGLAGAAVKGAAIGSVAGGTQSAISGEGFGKGALTGAATGAATGVVGNVLGNVANGVVQGVGSNAASDVLKETTSNTTSGVLESQGGSTAGITGTGTSTTVSETTGTVTPPVDGAGAIGSGINNTPGVNTMQGNVLESGATQGASPVGSSEVQQMTDLYVHDKSMPSSGISSSIDSFVSNGTPNTSRGKMDVAKGLNTMATAASLIQLPMQAAQAKEAGRQQEAAAYRQATLTELDRTEKLKAKAAMKENAFNKQQSAWAQTSLLKLDQKEATSLGLMEGSGRVRNQNNLKSGFKGTQL